MQMRLSVSEANPEAYEAMLGLEAFMQKSGIDHTLYHLIKTRASQLNGCAFCVDMHAKSLLESGELERLYLLPVWREAHCFTEKERAVLELTEVLTRISDVKVSDELYAKVMAHVSEKEFVTIVMAVNTINGWNRLMVSTGAFPGCFIPAKQA